MPESVFPADGVVRHSGAQSESSSPRLAGSSSISSGGISPKRREPPWRAPLCSAFSLSENSYVGIPTGTPSCWRAASIKTAISCTDGVVRHSDAQPIRQPASDDRVLPQACDQVLSRQWTHQADGVVRHLDAQPGPITCSPGDTRASVSMSPSCCRAETQKNGRALHSI